MKNSVEKTHVDVGASRVNGLFVFNSFVVAMIHKLF